MKFLNHNKNIKYINKPGIALTFDDSFRIRHWYKYGIGENRWYKNIFGFYNIRSTFNINAINQFESSRELNQSEIDMLIDIQSNGHELASHGYSHKNAVDYVKYYGADKWYNDEIKEMNEWISDKKHSKNGKKIKKFVSFAYPYSQYSDITNSLLENNGFVIYRAYKNDFLFLNCEHKGLTPSVCIDKKLLKRKIRILRLLKEAKRESKNIVLMCHSILPNRVKWDSFGFGKESVKDGEYRISPGMLKFIIFVGRIYGFEFYTLSDLAGVATFADDKFEIYIRQLTNNFKKTIPIRDLVDIKELDLSKSGISNLDGIQYFINLKKIILPGKDIDGIKILKRLKTLKSIEIVG